MRVSYASLLTGSAEAARPTGGESACEVPEDENEAIVTTKQQMITRLKDHLIGIAKSYLLGSMLPMR